MAYFSDLVTRLPDPARVSRALPAAITGLTLLAGLGEVVAVSAEAAPRIGSDRLSLLLWLILGIALCTQQLKWRRLSLLLATAAAIVPVFLVGNPQRADIGTASWVLTPVAAVVLFALGLATLCLQVERLPRRLVTTLAAIAGGLCTLALCGYALGIQPTTEWGPVAGRMSLPVAVCGVGAALYLIQASGSRLDRPLPLLSCSLAMVVALAVLGGRVLVQQRHAEALAQHTFRLVAEATRLELATVELRSAAYVAAVTGRRNSPADREPLVLNLQHSLERLRQLAEGTDDAGRVESIAAGIAWLVDWAATVRPAADGPPMVLTGYGGNQEVDRLVQEFVEFAESRLESRLQAAGVASQRVYLLGVAGGALAFALLVLAALFARRASVVALNASRLKSEFLANMSHEIRTPLNGVIGMLQMLDVATAGAEQREQVRVALRSADALIRLLNDILDLSKIESGKMELESLPTSLRQVVEETHTLLRARAEEKRLEFRVSVDPKVPAAVMSDAVRLKQVLLNLCANAIKFTQRGQVQLKVEAGGTDALRATLRFVVEDTGEGISPQAQRRLFRVFEQAEAGTARRFGGSGLGLAISQRLVARMGGEIRVTSALGRGSRFSFEVTLPVAAEPAPGDEAQIAPLAVPANRGQRILVAEDDKVGSYVICSLLRKLGLNCTVVGDGAAVVQLALHEPWDLILMDVQMPLMDGLEATRRIREAGGTVPIVALTADVMPRDRVACERAGMDGFLEKPVREAELRRCLHRWLPGAAIRAPLSSEASGTATRSEEVTAPAPP